jgi:hypothetical protein
MLATLLFWREDQLVLAVDTFCNLSAKYFLISKDVGDQVPRAGSSNQGSVFPFATCIIAYLVGFIMGSRSGGNCSQVFKL